MIRLAESHPTWALGFQAETWWSRLEIPTLHAWASARRPQRMIEQERPAADSAPKALACYGLLVSCPAASETLPEQVWLRFVDGRPVSGITTQFLAWCCRTLAELGKQALLIVWDNAGWHISHQVRHWIREHNRKVKQTGTGVRILAAYLPSKSPWLNPMEPHWLHGKRHVAEPSRLLTAQELADRACAHFHCPHDAHLSLTDQVS